MAGFGIKESALGWVFGCFRSHPGTLGCESFPRRLTHSRAAKTAVRDRPHTLRTDAGPSPHRRAKLANLFAGRSRIRRRRDIEQGVPRFQERLSFLQLSLRLISDSKKRPWRDTSGVSDLVLRLHALAPQVFHPAPAKSQASRSRFGEAERFTNQGDECPNLKSTDALLKVVTSASSSEPMTRVLRLGLSQRCSAAGSRSATSRRLADSS